MRFESHQQFQGRRRRNFINLYVRVPGSDFSAGGEAPPALTRALRPPEPGSVPCHAVPCRAVPCRAALEIWGVESLRVASSTLPCGAKVLPGLEQWLWGRSGQLPGPWLVERVAAGDRDGSSGAGVPVREPWRGESQGSFIVVWCWCRDDCVCLL